MYCRKCGNELRDVDEFCSKCGCKITKNFSENRQLHPTNTKLKLIKKFFIYLISFSTFVLLVYGIFTPPNFRIVDFIEDPAGFSRTIGQAFGSGLVMLIFTLPLLYGMKKINIIKETYKLEVFFMLMVTFEVGTWIFGEDFVRDIYSRVVFPAIIAGGLMLTYSRFKK